LGIEQDTSSPRCDFASRTFDRYAKKDPSPAATNLTTSILKLLKEFAELLYNNGDGDQRPLNDRQVTVLSRVLTLELFTSVTYHHFVLPSHYADRGESPVYERIRPFIIEWFDPTTSDGADYKLNDHVRRVALSARTKLTAGDFHELFVTLGERLERHFDYDDEDANETTSVYVGRKQYSPDVYISFDDLRRKNLRDENTTAIARWLENFIVRRYFIHSQLLKLAQIENGLKGTADARRLKAVNDHFRARAIFLEADKSEQFKCVYEQTLDTCAVNFQAQNWSNKAVMDLVKPKIVEALRNNQTLYKDLEIIFEKVKFFKFFVMDRGRGSVDRVRVVGGLRTR
jgi:hypothetical protein